jgi:hypothetical protein
MAIKLLMKQLKATQINLIDLRLNVTLIGNMVIIYVKWQWTYEVNAKYDMEEPR